MSRRIRLGKTGDSRRRGKDRQPVLSEEALLLKQQLVNGNAGLIDHLLQKGYSSSTIAGYVQGAANFEKWAEKENVPIGAVSYADILHYVQGKRGKLTQHSIGCMVNSIRHYFNYLQASGAVTENPAALIETKGIKRRTLHDILSRQELDGLYQDHEMELNEKNSHQNWYRSSQLAAKRNRVITGLLIYQGLTATELSRLKLKDVKLRDGKINIEGTRRSNGREMDLKAMQILDLMEYTLKIREELLKLSGKESDRLLVSAGKGTQIHNILAVLVKQLAKVNSKVSSLRQIRASVITHWLKSHNLRQTQYMAGHRFVSSTEAFLINDLEDLSEDVNKFHPIE